MPWIIADDEGRICHARKRIYTTERGAKCGFAAALDNYLQCWFLYDDEDLNYHFYVDKKIPAGDSFLGDLLCNIHRDTIKDPAEQQRRWDELTEQFKSMYSIQEVDMTLTRK